MSSALDRLWWMFPKTNSNNREELASLIKKAFNSSEIGYVERIEYYNNLISLGEGYVQQVDDYDISDRAQNNLDSDVLNFNVIGSAIKTQNSRIGEHKIIPSVITMGGNYDDYLKAKELDKYLEGTNHNNNTSRKMSQAQLDAGFCGTGFIKVFHNGKTVIVERVHPKEVFVNEYECQYGSPKTIYQRKEVSIGEMIELFPEYRDKLCESVGGSAKNSYVSGKSGDTLEVIECWHESKSFGRHCMIVSQGAFLLFDKPWKRKIPFAKFCYDESSTGYYGIGIVEQGASIQQEIIEVLGLIKENIRIHGSSTTYVPYNSVLKGALSNERGLVVELEEGASPPQRDTQASVSNQVFEYPFKLASELLSMLGISQSSAFSKHTPGIEAAKAMREMKASEQTRHKNQINRFEDFALDIANLIIETSKELYEESGELKVKWYNENVFEVIEWDDVNLPEDSYFVKILTVSGLSRDVAARTQEVSEMIAAGWAPMGRALKLLDIPDIDETNNVEMAAEKFASWIVTQGLIHNKRVEVDDYHHLELNIQRCRGAALEAQTRDAPQHLIDNLLYYMYQAEEKLNPKPKPLLPAPVQAPGPQEGPPQLALPAGLAQDLPQEIPNSQQLSLNPGEQVPQIQQVAEGAPLGIELPPELIK